MPEQRIRLGDALVAFGRELQLSDVDVDELVATRDTSTLDPIDFT